MHKKILVLFIIIIFAVGATNVAAQESKEDTTEEDTLVAGWDSHFNPGNVMLSGGVGLGGFWYGLGLNLYPGVEVIFAQPDIGGVVPLGFGIAARGIFGFYPALYAGFDIGVSALATAHLGLKGLDLNSKFLNSLDFYIGLGLSVFFVRPYSSYFLRYYFGDVVSPVQFASFQGVNYFVSDNFAIYLESTYLGLSNYYLTFGVLFKIGK